MSVPYIPFESFLDFTVKEHIKLNCKELDEIMSKYSIEKELCNLKKIENLDKLIRRNVEKISLISYFSELCYLIKKRSKKEIVFNQLFFENEKFEKLKKDLLDKYREKAEEEAINYVAWTIIKLCSELLEWNVLI